MLISLLALDGVFDTGLATVLDTLAAAASLASAEPGRAAPFAVEVASVRARVTTAHGMQVPVQRVQGRTDWIPSVVVVPGLGAKTPEEVGRALVRPDVRLAGSVLRERHAAGCTVAAACTGTYVLAAAGLLEGRRATTTWWLAPDFRRRFPGVRLEASEMVVADEGRITAGAALAHVDLALWLVRSVSPALAERTARHLLFEGRPSQAQYALMDFLAHADPVVERFERWVREHLASFSMPEAARAVGASERTIERRVARVLGRTPIAYVQDLRVEAAIHRLQTSDDSVEEIALAVGYRDGVTLRTLLRRKTGRGIRALRGRG